MANKAYRSSIPQTAREKVVARYPDGHRRKVQYRVRGKVVGERWFYESGELEREQSLKDGKRHGRLYFWYSPGVLTSMEPFVAGLPHGTAKQWAKDGRLLGTYVMRRGTGIDLWWWEHGGRKRVAEIHILKNGERHGFDWWLIGSSLVSQEQHFRANDLHGIERQWNLQNRLQRGFPKYFIAGQQVTKRRYLKACLTDESLPKYKASDNGPRRRFPAEVREAIGVERNSPKGKMYERDANISPPIYPNALGAPQPDDGI